MVLEEASSSTAEPSASFSENLPTSDIDPYSGNNGPYIDGRQTSYINVSPPGQTQIYINLANLPKRWGLLGAKQHPQAMIDGIKVQSKFASELMRRPVKQEEADAFAFHMAKSIRVASYGAPIGASIGIARAFQTRSTYRWPFFNPFKEGGRLSPDSFGPLKAQTARTAWQFLRMNMYLGVGMALGSMFFGSYALTLNAAGRAMDPRLKEFSEALTKRAREGRGVEAESRAADQMQGPKEGETGAMARQRSSAAQPRREMQGSWNLIRQRGGKPAEDDMSPTGGAFEDEYMSGGDSGLLDDGQSRQQQYQTSPVNVAASAAEMNAAPSQRQAQQSYNTTSSSQQQRPQQTGSSWDRLRQGAMSGNQNSPSSSSSSRQSTRVNTSASSTRAGDGDFSFSQNEKDRQLAKSEAQKDFDKRIEQEREGHDFSDGSSGSERGSRWS